MTPVFEMIYNERIPFSEVLMVENKEGGAMVLITSDVVTEKNIQQGQNGAGKQIY